jgi:hypothetical protein
VDPLTYVRVDITSSGRLSVYRDARIASEATKSLFRMQVRWERPALVTLRRLLEPGSELRARLSAMGFEAPEA